jgi:nucleoside-diphosphate-sugar epimerase
MEKILVTGGAGYKGSMLIPMLLERGHKVVIYDNFMFGPQAILHFSSNPNLEIVEGDIRDANKLAETVRKCDTVIHLAGIVGFPACAADPDQANSVNVNGSLNLAMSMSKLQRLMYASTGSTYGVVDGSCDETSPTNPLSLYGRNKLDSERIFQDRLDNLVMFRFATVFGIAPRLRVDLIINDFVHQALHNKQIILYEGHHKRTFIHIKDCANVYPFALDNWDEMNGQIYNVGDDRGNYSKKDVAEMIKKIIPYYLHEADVGEDADKRDYTVKYDKIKKLGYERTIDVVDGIDEIAKVMKFVRFKNPWRNHG